MLRVNLLLSFLAISLSAFAAQNIPPSVNVASNTLLIQVGGSDATGKRGTSLAYASFARAVSNSFPGDSIQINAGSFVETNLTYCNGVNIRGAGKDVTVLNFGDSSSPVFFNNCYLQDCTIHQTNHLGSMNIGDTIGASTNVFVNCHLIGHSDVFSLNQPTGLKLNIGVTLINCDVDFELDWLLFTQTDAPRVPQLTLRAENCLFNNHFENWLAPAIGTRAKGINCSAGVTNSFILLKNNTFFYSDVTNFPAVAAMADFGGNATNSQAWVKDNFCKYVGQFGFKAWDDFLNQFTNNPISMTNMVFANNLYMSNGYPAQASGPALISFPNTTVNWTNLFGIPIVLYVDNTGVTGTVIKKNGQQIFGTVFATDYSLEFKPLDYFSETYTVGTPTARMEPR